MDEGGSAESKSASSSSSSEDEAEEEGGSEYEEESGTVEDQERGAHTVRYNTAKQVAKGGIKEAGLYKMLSQRGIFQDYYNFCIKSVKGGTADSAKTLETQKKPELRFVRAFAFFVMSNQPQTPQSQTGARIGAECVLEKGARKGKLHSVGHSAGGRRRWRAVTIEVLPLLILLGSLLVVV